MLRVGDARRSWLTEAACGSDPDDAYLLLPVEDGQCQPVADREQRVLPRPGDDSLAPRSQHGECPEQFEVEKGCCQGNDAFTKFRLHRPGPGHSLGVLQRPCKAMEEANCTHATVCAHQRSYAVHNLPEPGIPATGMAVAGIL